MNNSLPTTPESQLKAAIDTFEASLVRPIVSGELRAWLDELRTSWKEAAAQVHFHAKHLHPRQYEAIAKQAPELLPRIELLRSEDHAIEEQRERFAHALERIAGHTPSVEPDEAKAVKLIESLVDDGTKLIFRIRRQSSAVQTWYLEAFNRDDGAVD